MGARALQVEGEWGRTWKRGSRTQRERRAEGLAQQGAGLDAPANRPTVSTESCTAVPEKVPPTGVQAGKWGRQKPAPDAHEPFPLRLTQHLGPSLCAIRTDMLFAASPLS